jgi:hypothetical protein
MKKLILSAAIVLGSFSAFAQTAPSSKTKMALNAVTKEAVAQEKYKEVKAEELPEAVKTALKTTYPDATLAKVYVNQKKEYKMEITVGDQKATTVYCDAEGTWLKK